MKLPFLRSREEITLSGPEPAQFPAIYGADLAGMVQGRRVGGDFYHFVRVNPRRLLFGLLDVAGRHAENHGIVEAAQQAFQQIGCEKFASDDVNEADAMMEFCLQLNLCILRTAKGVRSSSAFLGCYNEDLGTVCYANAGHTPGLLRYGNDITELPATGLPLGLITASTYEAPTVAVPPGASLLLVSRGVVEASFKKEEFGLQRVKQKFERLPLDSASQVASQMLDSVREYMREPPTHNDVTTFALIRAAMPKAAAVNA
jgi:sigma-B regulation protein RsbU (phosphoserine phosphatase)